MPHNFRHKFRTDGTLIPPSTGSQDIFIGNNSIGTSTGEGKLEVRADYNHLFTNMNWSTAIRFIGQNESGSQKHAAAIVWDKGSTIGGGASLAPYHYFMAGPADNPRGDFYTGWAASYGNSSGNPPIYSSSVFAAQRNGVNPIGSIRFFKNFLVHDGNATPANRVGIGVLAPTEQLHTNQGVRFEGLTSNTSPTRILIQDATGKLFYRDLSTLPSSSLTNSCTSGNYLPKVNSSNSDDFVCSQVYDNGTNVGIATSNPKTQLHVDGGSLWLTGGSAPNISGAGSGLRLYSDANGGSIFSYSYSSPNGPTDLRLQITGGAVGIGMSPGTWTGGGASIQGNPTNPTDVRLDVSGMIRSTYLVVTSDERLKTNITDLNSSLEKVLSLRGVYYNWTKDTSMNLDDFRQIGFIAQEVEQILPEVVGQDEKGNYAMNYQAIIPVLAEAIKEQNNKIVELENTISDLVESGSVNTGIDNANPNTSTAQMFQNKPNPFNQETIITCFVPESASTASLMIFDMQGKQLKKIDIQQKGKSETVIHANELNFGIYLYSLVVDGKEISTKRMIISK